MPLNSFQVQKAMGKKIANKSDPAGPQGRFAGNMPVDRREQRKIDQELGLQAFACKLPSTLVEQLRAGSAAHPDGLNGLVAELLSKALAK